MSDIKFLFRSGLAIPFLLAIACTAGGQSKDFKAVADLKMFREAFASNSAKIQTITSEFRQEKKLFALTENMTSTGRFWFKRSNMVRIEYEKPFFYRVIMNGDKVVVKDDLQQSSVSVRSSKLFQQVNQIILDCIQGTILKNKDFNTTVSENEKFFKLQMVPVQKSMRDFFSIINLIVLKTDYSVESIEMLEPSGDATMMTFSDKVITKSVDDQIFAY